jgi:hypothetical protein
VQLVYHVRCAKKQKQNNIENNNSGYGALFNAALSSPFCFLAAAITILVIPFSRGDKKKEGEKRNWQRGFLFGFSDLHLFLEMERFRKILHAFFFFLFSGSAFSQLDPHEGLSVFVLLGVICDTRTPCKLFWSLSTATKN